MAFLVVRPVREHDIAGPIEGDAVVAIGQILGGEPEVQRMSCHQVERPARRERGRAGPERRGVQLTHEGDVSHGVAPVVGAEVEVIHSECLLEHRRVWALGDGHEHRIDVAHVMTAHNVRAVGESQWVRATRRAKQQRRGVDRAARDDDDVGSVRLGGAGAFDDDLADLAAGRTRLEPRDVRARDERHVRILKCRVHTEDLGVGLGVDETRMPIAGVAPDALAMPRILLVQHDAERHVERP